MRPLTPRLPPQNAPPLSRSARHFAQQRPGSHITMPAPNHGSLSSSSSSPFLLNNSSYAPTSEHWKKMMIRAPPAARARCGSASRGAASKKERGARFVAPVMIRNSAPLASKMLFVQVLAASVRASHGPHQTPTVQAQGQVFPTFFWSNPHRHKSGILFGY